MPVRKQCRGAPGLRAGALLEEQEFSSAMVDPRFAQVDHDLQREDEVSVEVAVQGVPVPLDVAQQDRRRLVLPGVVAHAQPFVQRVRPRGGAAELRVPVAGDRQQPGVQCLLEPFTGSGYGTLK